MAAFGGSAFAAGANPRRIDTHCHVVPPAFVTAHHMENVDEFKVWSVARQLEEMDKYGIQTGIQGLNSPGVDLVDQAAAIKLARDCNEYAAKLNIDFPGRFGLFAALPFPDIEGCLKEIEYSLDVLKADGIYTQTSYGRQYLGDPAFAPVWSELNRRGAVVFAHPHAPEFCDNLIPGVPGAVIEYATDTTRAIASWLFSGAATQFPNVRFIFCHAGGTVPFILERFTRLANRKDNAEKLPNGALHELKRFYYECAQAAHPGAMPSLLNMVPMSQILFGTDFPYRTAREIADGLASCDLNEKQRAAINRDNALQLFPRFN